jgi:hypothetical protein
MKRYCKVFSAIVWLLFNAVLLLFVRNIEERICLSKKFRGKGIKRDKGGSLRKFMEFFK